MMEANTQGKTLSRDALVTQLIAVLDDFIADWDTELDEAMSEDTLLLEDLGFESIDIIQLVVAIEEAVGRRKLPFDRLLMEDGRYVDDLTIGQIADFLLEELQ